MKLALFESTTITKLNKQPSLTIIAAPSGYKTWQFINFHVIGTQFVLNNYTTTESVAVQTIKSIFPDRFITTSSIDEIGKVEKIILERKIDEAYSFTYPTLGIEPLSLDDYDYAASASTVRKFIEKNFEMAQELENSAQTEEIYKIAFPKDDTDYNAFWSSTLLTDEEKAICRHDYDADLSMSNAKRATRWIFEKVLETKYYTKPYTLIGLHGNPGSGKTKMVCEDYCAGHNVPLLYITLDEMSSVYKMMETVGPEAVNGEVKLTLQQSIWLKCFANNLPLVVCFDEANLMKTNQYNTLSAIVSESKANIGVHAYKGSYSIKYILCWNPDTSNVKSFDGKFYDRMTFIQVEDPSKEDRIKYKTNKILTGMSGSETNCSPEALEWEKELNKNTTSFKGKFLGEVTLAPEKERSKAIEVIYNLVEKINNELYTLTKGKDVKNPNKNSYFYISDRNMEYFMDLIFGYRSVNAAVMRIITDTVPGGKTVKLSETSGKDSMVDTVPLMIATQICEKLAGDITSVNNTLFLDIKQDDVDKMKSYIDNLAYVKEAWVDPTPNQPDVADEIEETVNNFQDDALRQQVLQEVEAILNG